MIHKLWEQHKIKRRPYVLKIIVPFALSLVATWLNLQPWSLVGTHSPFLLLFLAVFFSACYGGWWSAMLCTLSCTIAAVGVIFPMHQSQPSFYFAIMLFLMEGLMLSCLFHLIEEIYDRLRHSEARFRGMVEKSAEGFLLANADGLIKYAAPGAAGLLGYTIDELKNTPIKSMLHPDEQRAFELHWLKLSARFGDKVNFLQRLKTSRGKWMWIEGTVSNLLNEPQVKALVFHYRDITERVNREKQQEDFVHMASHELKTPITALKGFAQLIRLNHSKEGRKNDIPMLDRMELQLNKMLGLIDDMLDMTRIKAGELHYHFTVFDLRECVTDVIEAIQATTPVHRLVLADGVALPVRADRDKVGQVVNNLVTNAIKYSPGKDIVELKLENDGVRAHVKVRDHGIGIPKNKQQKVFDHFYRVDTLPKASFEGLGLGLYISMDIVKRHRGQMGLESEEGKGTEFWFSLPLNPAS